MITDLPTEENFNKTGQGMLNAAWESLSRLLIDLDELEEAKGSLEEALEPAEHEAYWSSARHTLTMSFAHVQQGVEFLIKARIVAVNPYVLLTGAPSGWPRNCDKTDTPFSSFRTIDAQDLLRVHDTVCKHRFDDTFRNWYRRMRTMRNRIVHTVDPSLSVDSREVARAILAAYRYLVSPGGWIKARRTYLSTSPGHIVVLSHEAENEAWILFALLREVRHIAALLTPTECKEHFGYLKKAPASYCPACSATLREMEYFDPDYHPDYMPSFQVVDPTEPRRLSCFVCGYQGELTESKCETCGTMSIEGVSGACVSCGDRPITLP